MITIMRLLRALPIFVFLITTMFLLEANSQEQKNIPWDIPQPNILKGKLSSYHFKSRILKNRREIWVYSPPGYSSKNEPYPLLLVFDGQAYTNELIPGPIILDNLIGARKIKPVVAIFISSMDQKRRNLELPCYDPFINSLADELLPWAHEHFHVSKLAEETIVAGSSYGGLAATYAALKRPERFGKVLSQSGAFWWQPAGYRSGAWLVKQYENVLPHRTQFYLDVGNQETGESKDCLSMVKVNRLFRDLLRNKGCQVTYQEFPGGHDYECWRKTFADGLMALLGN